MVKLKHKKNQLYKELTVTKEPSGGSYERLDIFNINEKRMGTYMCNGCE